MTGCLAKEVKKMSKLLTPKDVAEILQVSYDSALAFLKYSGVDALQIGRQYRVTEEKLWAFLNKKGSIVVDLNEPLR